MRLPWLRSLGARLLLTTVGLVLLVTVLVGAVTALAVRAYLVDQLDDQVIATLERAEQAPVLGPASPAPAAPDELDLGDGDGRDGDGRGDGDGPDRIDERRGQGVGTLTAIWSEDGAAGVGDVIVQEARGTTSRPALTAETLAVIDQLAPDGEPRSVDLDGLGTYRIAVASDSDGSGKLAAGLPSGDVGDVVINLVTWQAVLTVTGGVLAAGLGLVLLRRQLQPLHQVAATAHDVARLPLARGDISLAPRVPEHLADEGTEVGQVGSALNQLLDHVESSLSARHRSEQQVRQFVADASHELRTPLTTIGGYAGFARRHPEDAGAQRAALAKVEEEAARMTSLVEDLLLLARLDAGRPLERAAVDLTRLVVEATADARLLAPEHQWHLNLPDQVVHVLGDEQRLHQVLTNLVTNARKYTPPGTTVTVTVLDRGFAVHDDGPGFPPEIVDTAFERFTRGDASRHREGGAGLGLSLAAAIVAAHDGELTLDTRPGSTRLEVLLTPSPPPA